MQAGRLQCRGRALESFTRYMKRLPAFLRQSLAYDRGSEAATRTPMACLLLQFMPKGTELSVLSQTQLNGIARLLNGRPKETLNRHTSKEVMSEEISSFQSRVALEC